ncbi:hypothetical protein BZL54_21955 [Burkholderia ubonensis subsp. mesacidophila]|uniref:Uncharacterized protein n=1 Tax=Burkholderia ubonensis subsp. mesacidophila TaxID=265293 RepID=A0A2A4FDD7_9BURK|nr:hypothetical protein BZL54_21955 [Burkholderia ubonensis subsp. mesacidophila]
MNEIWKVVEEVAKPLGGFIAAGGIAHWFQRRRDQATARMDRARDNAERLEQYAYDTHDRIEANNEARPDDGPYKFTLPALADAASTGDGHRDHALLNAYRDLQIEITRANRYVALTDQGQWHGDSALDTLDRRAYRVAARALELADAYRRRVDMRRAPLAPAEIKLERYIRDRARFDAGWPSVVRPMACVRYARARRRLVRAGYVRLN